MFLHALFSLGVSLSMLCTHCRYLAAVWKLPQSLPFACVFPPGRYCRSFVVATLFPQLWSTLLFKTSVRDTQVLSQFNHMGFFSEPRLPCRLLAAVFIISSCKAILVVKQQHKGSRLRASPYRCALPWPQEWAQLDHTTHLSLGSHILWKTTLHPLHICLLAVANQ